MSFIQLASAEWDVHNTVANRVNIGTRSVRQHWREDWLREKLVNQGRVSFFGVFWAFWACYSYVSKRGGCIFIWGSCHFLTYQLEIFMGVYQGHVEACPQPR